MYLTLYEFPFPRIAGWGSHLWILLCRERWNPQITSKACKGLWNEYALFVSYYESAYSEEKRDESFVCKDSWMLDSTDLQTCYHQSVHTDIFVRIIFVWLAQS